MEKPNGELVNQCYINLS